MPTISMYSLNQKNNTNLKLKAMKKLIIVVSLVLIKTAHAQDLIVFTDSSKVKAVISEISNDNVKYKRYDMPEGPKYTVDRKTVAYVKYKNGNTERLQEPMQSTGFDYSVYNMDGSRPRTIKNEQGIVKSKAHLYKRKNYIGFNHLALLNSNLSFSFMHDLAKEKLILHLPLSFGYGKPDLTNSVYNGSYLYWRNSTHYNRMNYSVGAGLLFSPSFGHSVNFLIGPSFSVSQYEMSTKASITTMVPNQGPVVIEEYKNDFILIRQVYGGTIGFLFRISERLNMTALANIGCKKDAYNESDPFGIEYINKKTNYNNVPNANVLPYANFSWTIGYRF